MKLPLIQCILTMKRLILCLLLGLVPVVGQSTNTIDTEVRAPFLYIQGSGTQVIYPAFRKVSYWTNTFTATNSVSYRDDAGNWVTNGPGTISRTHKVVDHVWPYHPLNWRLTEMTDTHFFQLGGNMDTNRLTWTNRVRVNHPWFSNVFVASNSTHQAKQVTMTEQTWKDGPMNLYVLEDYSTNSGATFYAPLDYVVADPLGDGYPTPDRLFLNRVSQPVTVDGDLSEWIGTWIDRPAFKTREGDWVTFEPYGANASWTGPEDHSIRFMAQHDTNSVYLGIEVTDDEHDTSLNSAWNGDALQLLVVAEDVVRYNCALTSTGIVATGSSEVVSAIQRNSNKTTYELQFPKPELGDFRLAFCVNDGDFASPGQRGWSGFHPYGIVFGGAATNSAKVSTP